MEAVTTHIETEKHLVPELRFMEYEDNWEKYRMEQLADCYDGTHQTPKYVESGVPFVSVENVKSYATKSKFITKEAFNKDFKNTPKKGDVFMTRITAGIIGMTSIVENDDDLAYYVSVALIRKKKNIGSSFLAHRIESEGFKRELHKKIIHVAFPKKINLGDLQKCVTYIPSLPEQQKIASFLSVVDEKIQKLTKKKKLLEQYKKGVMQQLFSGQLRFKDENGNPYPVWEEKRLGEIVEIMTDYVASGSFESLRNNVNVYDELDHALYVRLTDLRRDLKHDSLKYVDKPSFDFLAKSNLYGGELLIANIGANVGDVYLMPFNIGHATIAPNMIVIRENKPEFHSIYLFYYLHSYGGRKAVNMAISGSGQPKLSKTDFKKVKLNLPSHKEQQKIATYLSSIDAKIESINQQITQTQTFKKGLLQQMFV